MVGWRGKVWRFVVRSHLDSSGGEGSLLRELRVCRARPISPGAMAVQGEGEVVPFQMEMFLSQSSLAAVMGEPVAWLQDESDEMIRQWRATGFDNRLFPGGTVPFKAVLRAPGGKVVHNVAAKYYALAHRKEFVEGPPVALVSITVPPDTFYRALVKGDVVVHSDQLTIGFCKPLTPECFPGILGPNVHLLDDGLGLRVLSEGQELLNSRCSPY